MKTIHRKDWSRGWVPSHDAINAPGLLRMDNCTLDERGAVVVRRGSEKINQSAFADLDVHSLFTAHISGTRYRMAGVNETVYANGVPIVGPFAGAPASGARFNPIYFGAGQGQIFMARSTTKKKYDGTTVRNWGIQAPAGAPTVAAVAADSKTFATCDNAESPGFTADEGTVAQATGQDGTANGSVELTANSATARGTMTKTFAGETDFTVYDSAAVGHDDDLIDAYVYITDPADVRSITMMIDCNSDSTNRFQDDYFTYTFRNGETINVRRTPEDYIQFDDSLTDGVDVGQRMSPEHRQNLLDRVSPIADRPPVSTFRRDKPVVNAGWNHFTLARAKMQRIGSTANKGWNTVKAIRFVVEGYPLGIGVPVPVVRFDTVKIVGGKTRPLTGTYQWRYAFAYNTGEYVALSPLSPASLDLELKAQAANVTIPTASLTAAVAAGDTFNEIWIYRFGGYADQYYRIEQSTDVTDPVVVEDNVSDRDAMVINIPAELNNEPPPDDIVGIAGPYYSRMFLLTGDSLYPSRRGNPESFSSEQVIQIADTTEQALWIVQTTGGLYVGTTKDIYLIDGQGDELEDLSIDLRKRNLNVASPPIGTDVTAEGNMIYYLAREGWRQFNGLVTRPIVGDTELLWRGHIRHEAPKINTLARPTANFACAAAHGIFHAITPEIEPPEQPNFTAVTGSSTVFRWDSVKDRWYRHTYYRAAFWISMHREPDGTVIAGDSAGFVWAIDQPNTNQDDGEDIPVTIWTARDDDGQPLTRKDPQLFRIRVDTYTNTATVDFHIHGSVTSSLSKRLVKDGSKTWGDSLVDLGSFIEFQLRITGDFNTFKLHEFEIEHLVLPVQTRGQHAYSNDGYGGEKMISGLFFRVNTLGHAAHFTPLFDGVEQTPFLVQSTEDDPTDYIHKLTGGSKVTEVAFVTDCPIELYDWKILTMYRFPLARRVWDTGELDIGRVYTWVREIRIKAEAASDLTVTPYFDDVAFAAYTATVTADKTKIYTVPMGRGYRGSVPRVVVTSSGNFKPYWMEIVERPSDDASQKKRAHRITPNFGHQPGVAA